MSEIKRYCDSCDARGECFYIDSGGMFPCDTCDGEGFTLTEIPDVSALEARIEVLDELAEIGRANVQMTLAEAALDGNAYASAMRRRDAETEAYCAKMAREGDGREGGEAVTETLLDRIKNACRPVGYPDEYRLIRTDNLALLVAAVEAGDRYVSMFDHWEKLPREEREMVQIELCRALSDLREALRAIGLTPTQAESPAPSPNPEEPKGE